MQVSIYIGDAQSCFTAIIVSDDKAGFLHKKDKQFFYGQNDGLRYEAKSFRELKGVLLKLFPDMNRCKDDAGFLSKWKATK